MTRLASGKPLIFVSCGQRTEDERKLGADVCRLIDETTPFKAYFAEEQNSLEGLTDHIFRRLHRARGFVCVMHRRGTVTFSDGSSQERASVFIEQEIAILSFLQLVMGEEIPVAAFIEDGIALEGVREFIPFNPRVFQTPSDVLIELARLLQSWRPRPRAVLQVGIRVNRGIGYEAQAQRYRDLLVVTLSNCGLKPIEKYVVEVEIPKGVIDSGPYYPLKVDSRSTGNVDFFRLTEQVRQPPTIYPEDVVDVWHMPFDSVSDSEIGKMEARATLRVEDQDPLTASTRLDGTSGDKE